LHSVHRKHGLWNVFPDAFTCSAKYTGFEQRAHSGGGARPLHPPELVVEPVDSGLKGFVGLSGLVPPPPPRFLVGLSGPFKLSVPVQFPVRAAP